ncbi:MAG: RagB/SusD family nutrient uptake outer membrane protein [Bacteroidaceae bacterium]|nr:RagB/SusD family nutrient uptake outer membrane protein [Bacteroidaceae bacterium]
MKKKIKNIALCSLVALAVGAGLSSCEDYLTITPTDRIVEEDFWEDKNDLQNVVNACYARLIHGDIMDKYIQWGEMRSDNFERATGSSALNILNLMNANLLSTNRMFDWTVFYNAINYCNKVLAHGEETVQKDESFSRGDWMPIRAEMITLRAFCHYYLVRTFGEVPYVTFEYNNDSQNFLIGQSTQIQVLDSIINDLELVKSYAMNDYGNTVENAGRVTKKTVYAFLADAYLWRASYKAGNPSITGSTTAQQDYEKCVEYCDWVLDYMVESYKKELNKSGKVIGGVTDLTVEDLLIPNMESTTDNKILPNQLIGAYDYVFGSGNSRETIFELQLDGTNNSNSTMQSYFYNISNRTIGSLVCSSTLLGNVETNPNTLSPSNIYTKTDYRRYETAMYTGSDQTDFPMCKYIVNSVMQYNGTSTSSGMKDNSGTTAISVSYNMKSVPLSSNWIVYRLSDIILMKAEAMSQLYSDEAHMKEAFNLVRMIFKRANPLAYENRPTAADSLDFNVFNTSEGIENLVMQERQREFLGEGKRWFDLVRYAQRRNSTTDMLKMLTRKYGDNKKAIEAKLATMKSLFSPIYTDEIKSNSLLHQNEVWGTEESSSRTDNL